MILRHREIVAILAAHFLTFFSSNFLKNALVFLVLLTLPQTEAEGVVAMVSATFMVPMIFLSGVGGRMADHYDKRSLARWLKGAEVAFVAVAVGGVIFNDFWIVLAGLVGMQIVGSLFGPLRSALVVAVLPKERLALANAWIEAGTFSAMVSGIAFVGFVFALPEDVRVYVALGLLFASVGCFLAIQFVPNIPRLRDPAAKMDWNFLMATKAVVGDLISSEMMRTVALKLAWTWFSASLVLSTYAALISRFTDKTSFVSAVMLIIGVFGVVGAQLAARLKPAEKSGDIFLMLTGIVMSGVGGCVTFWQGSENTAMVVLLFLASLLSFLQSLMQIPLVTSLQSASASEEIGRVMAGSNVLNAIAMVGGGYLVWLTQLGSLDLADIYVLTGAVSALIGSYAICSVSRFGPNRVH